MSSPTNKPRDIKNLKARLGRTITPGQAGMPGGAPPSGSVPPSAPGGFPGTPGGPFGSAPGGVPRASNPPTASNPFGGPAGMPRASAPPGAAPRPASGPGLSRPPLGGAPMGAPTPGPGGLPKPVVGGLPKPVVGPAAQASAAAQAPAASPAKTGAKGGANPFAAAAPGSIGVEKKVTLVIDSSAVNEAEIGRKSATRSAMLVVIGAIVGIAVGWGIGGTTQERTQFRLAVQDGKEIYQKVQEVSKVIEVAQQNLKKAVDAAQSRPGATASVDYNAVKALVALERPLSANEFHRRRYLAFPKGVVDDLFDYYNNINLIWDKFTLLGVKTTGAGKQAALDESARAADGLIKTQYGAVLSKTGDMITAGLVYVEVPEGEAAAEEPAEEEEGKKGKKDEEKEGPKVQVASNQGGKTVEREVYIGQEDFGEEFAKYVLMLDKMRSRTILGEGASLFAGYQGLLMEINGLMTKVVESQGRLTKELGKVAALSQ